MICLKSLLSGQLRGRTIETRWEQCLSTTSPTVSRSSTSMSGLMNYDFICCHARLSTRSSAIKPIWPQNTGQWRRLRAGGLPPGAVVSTSSKLRQRLGRTSRKCLPSLLVTFTRCWSAEWSRSRRAGTALRRDSAMGTPACDCVCPAAGLRALGQIAAASDVEN